ncbi:hypothetical protein D0B54_07445 [Solimonas sp. K1W22B-7]|uniref:WD40/YVTN/BNR-like repeat-containing protein n=1 Tax=Solimonas sp. K1W22B-7 TaxID=2303331 RepID=UPI000E334BB1|nr:YCF48-related protein [Solimonas sp. K1W22B-7]AXQ28527.1 hypothetical protein D0B54_07445 [Solimonas sp. K1W22B-7]
MNHSFTTMRRGLLMMVVAAAIMSGPTVGASVPTVADVGSARTRLLASATPHLPLFDVSAGSSKLFAAGAGGRIVRSDDGGQHWSSEKSCTQLSLLGVSNAGEHAVAVGQMGVLCIRKADGSWAQVDTRTTERLFDVAINSKGAGVAVGAFGVVLRTTNGGADWVPAAPLWFGVFRDGAGRLGESFAPSLYGVQMDDEGNAWVVGELGLVMTSADGGTSWAVRRAGGNDDLGVDPTVSGIHMQKNGVGYAVGQQGLLLRTGDHGVSWAELPRPSHANLLGVVGSERGAVLITGMRDMRVSRDGGKTFQMVEGDDVSTGWYHGAVLAPGGDAALTVGIAGHVLSVRWQ